MIRFTYFLLLITLSTVFNPSYSALPAGDALAEPCDGFVADFAWEWVPGTNSVSFVSTGSDLENWWQWSMAGEGIIISDNNDFTYTFPGPGTYEVCLLTGDLMECTSDICMAVTVGGSIPCDGFAVNFESNIICDPAPLPCIAVFTGTSTLEASWWSWDFGDGTTGVGEVVTTIYNEPGLYTVCFTAGFGEDCEATTCYDIIIGEGDPCEGYSADFTWSATPSGGVLFTPTSEPEALEWFWDFGDGATSGEWVTDHYYSSPGIYTACLTVWYADGCSVDVCYDILIGESPCDLFEVSFDWTLIPGTNTVEFISTSGPGENWSQWWLGGMMIGNEETLTYTFPAPGTYDICLVSGIGDDCIFEDCQTLVIGEGDPCEGNYLNFEWNYDPASGAMLFWPIAEPAPMEFIWSFGDGSTDSEDWMASHVYEEPGVYNVCLSVWFDEGCDLEICHDIYVGDPCAEFIAGFDYEIISDPSGEPFVVLFDGWALPGADWFWWDFGDGTEGDGMSNVHTYTTPGTYIVCLTAGIGEDCVATSCYEIIIGGTDPCFGYYADFEWENTPSGGIVFYPFSSVEALEWSWNFGDGSTTSDEWVTDHNYEEPGIYTVCLTVWFGGGCSTETCYDVIVGGGPCDFFEADFTWEWIPGTTVVVLNNTSGPGMPWSQWWIDGSLVGDGPVLEMPFPGPGTYTVCLETGIGEDCVDEVCYDVLIGDPPCGGVELGFDYEILCDFVPVPCAVAFEGWSSPGAVSWSWDFGDGLEGDGINPVHTYSEAGVYLVCVTVNFGEECFETFCQEIVIGGGGPCEGYNADFTWTNVPGTTTVVFADNSTEGVNWWHWWYEGEIIGEGPIFDYTFPEPGTYTICLSSGIGDDCIDEICHTLIVGETGPCVGFNTDFTWSVEPGTTTVAFTDNSTEGVDWWHWWYDGEIIGDGPVFEYTFPGPGTYTICLSSGIGEVCEEQMCYTFTLGETDPCEGLSVDFEYNIICEPAIGPCVVTFDAMTSPGTGWYVWEFGDGTMGFGPSQVHTYLTPGSYTVCLSSGIGELCEETTCYNIFVGFSDPCEGYFLNFDWNYDPISGSVNFWPEADPLPLESIWHFGDGTSSDEDWMASHTYEEPGVYNACLVALYADGCVVESCQEIVIGDEPCSTYTANFDWEWIPGSNTVVFNDNSSEGVNWWHWWYDGEIVGDGPVLEYTFPEPGIYTLCLASGIGDDCVDEICYDVLVGDPGPCDGFEVGFEVEVSCGFLSPPCIAYFEAFSSLDAEWWVWDFGDGSAGEGPSPVHTYLEAGVYVVCLTAGIGEDCVETSCYEIWVGETDPCDGYFADFEWELNPSGGIIFYPFSEPDALEWAWDFGDGSGTDGEWITDHNYEEAGIYTVCLTVWFGDGCFTEICHEIAIGIDPCESFEADFTWEWLPGTTSIVLLDNSSPGANWWNWWHSGTLVGEGAAFTMTFEGPGVYTICLSSGIGDDGPGVDCEDEICYDIEIGPGVPGCDDLEAWFDSFFSPGSLGVEFENLSAGTFDYISWDFGDGNSSLEENPYHEYSDPGYYEVCLYIEYQDTCASEYCSIIGVEASGSCDGLVVDFEYEAALEGFGFYFLNTTTGFYDAWEWLLSTGDTLSEESPFYEFNSPGLYEVCLVAYRGDSCINNICKWVDVIGSAIDDPDLESSISLFPNPARPQDGSIRIQWEGVNLADQGQLLITDLSGRILYERQISAGQASLDIPIDPSWAAGMYMAKIISKQQNYVRKWVLFR